MKLVMEHINKVAKFTRGNKDKMSSLGVGQIHLIKSWLDEMNVKDYVINDDLTIDVNDNVNLRHRNLITFPNYIQFFEVSGFFDCSNNQLISLKGCPKLVNRSFWCGNNQLISLEGCPKIVNSSFKCYNNKKRFTEDEVKQYCDIRGTITI